MESACSGIPYTCSYPGNEMSIPTDEGPVIQLMFLCMISLYPEWFADIK